MTDRTKDQDLDTEDMRSPIRAFFLGMREFRLTLTTRCNHDIAYDWGREWAHRLTLRRLEV